MGQFNIIDAKDGYRFNLKADNYEIIGKGNKAFDSVEECEQMIGKVKKLISAEIVDSTIGVKSDEACFMIYSDVADEYRFRLLGTGKYGPNLSPVYLSSESYPAKQNCLKGIESVKENAPDAEIVVA